MFPEIFLSLSIFSILMIGVCKKGFNLIFNLTSLIIIITISIIINQMTRKHIFDSLTREFFSNYFKILIFLSSLFVLNSSKKFILDITR